MARPVKDLQELKERVLRSLAKGYNGDSAWECAERGMLEWVMEQIDGKEDLYALHMGDDDPYADHVYCSVCRECVTCNLRPCRDGGAHS